MFCVCSLARQNWPESPLYYQFWVPCSAPWSYRVEGQGAVSISHKTLIIRSRKNLGGERTMFIVFLVLKFAKCPGSIATKPISQLTKRLHHFNIKSRGFETWRDITGYWNLSWCYLVVGHPLHTSRCGNSYTSLLLQSSTRAEMRSETGVTQ